MKRVLVIGGYGGFGARIAQLLAQDDFLVLVGGRNAAKAAAFCGAQAEGVFEPITVDRATIDTAGIRALDLWALVDAAGPWQGDGHRLPEACIAAGCHYCDIADARDFVGRIDELDKAARNAGVVLVSGASTAPALTAAVCDVLTADLDRVTKIEARLAASNRATGSASITSAILSYAGKPIRLWRGGRWRKVFGWLEMERSVFDRTGRPYRRLVGLCDVPDHDLFPARYPGTPATLFRAGTEIGLQNRAIQATAMLVRLGLVPDGRWFAGPARLVQRLMRRMGGDRSAMRMDITGWRGGEALKRRWELLAEQGDGPWVPCLAVPPLLAKLRDDELATGARSAAGTVSLADYQRMMAPFALEEQCETRRYVPLYERVMGEDFVALPPSLQAMHRVAGELVAKGEASIEPARNPLSRMIGRLFRFPPAGDQVPLQVWMDERSGVERWTRDFGGHEMRSELSQKDGLMVERFGPFRFGFELRAGPDGLSMHLRRWWCWALPLPLCLAPESPAREYEADGRFNLDVPISLPLVGLVVRYRGWLVPVRPEKPRGRSA